MTVALFGLLGAFPAVSDAAGTGRVSGTTAMTSGSFGVTPVAAGTTTAASPMTFVLLGTPQYLDALNTGSLGLTGTTYSVTLTFSGVGTPTFTLSSCPSGTWTLGICSTTEQTIGTWTTGTASVSTTVSGRFPATAGQRLPLKAVIAGASVLVTATATVSASVSSGPTRQVRAATTTNG